MHTGCYLEYVRFFLLAVSMLLGDVDILKGGSNIESCIPIITGRVYGWNVLYHSLGYRCSVRWQHF